MKQFKLKSPLRLNAAFFSILALLSTTALHAKQEKLTFWGDHGTYRGDLTLETSDNQVATFLLNQVNGSARIELDYSGGPLDFSRYIYTALKANNASGGKFDITIYVLSDPAETWSNQQVGRFILDPQESKPLKAFMLREELGRDSEWVKKLGNLYALPGGFHRHWRFLETSKISKIGLSIQWSGASGKQPTLALSQPFGAELIDYSEELLQSLPTPLVDEYGQLRGQSWEGRISQGMELSLDGARDLARYNGARFAQPQLNQYGGWLGGPQLEATGRFRTEKVEGKWWFVDPEGRLFWSIGVTEAGIGSLTRHEGRESLFPELEPKDNSDLWVLERGLSMSYNFYHANLIKKYGADWKKAHHQVSEGRMRTWGLNTAGAWSMEPGTVFKHKRPSLPYTVIVHTDLNGGIGYMHEMIDPYSTQFEDSLDTVLREAAKETSGDPNNLGIFVNNELQWWGGLDHPVEVLAQDISMPAKQALVDQMQRKYRTISALNTAWNSHFANFEELTMKESIRDNNHFIADMKAFYKDFAETFFRKCKNAVEKHFPGHLYMGSRFNHYPPTVTRAASKYCDVISFNLYQNSVGSFHVETEVDRPFLISEFHFGTGSHGVWGRGLTPCADAENQGDLYRTYVTEALEHPNFVGAHWFTWADQPVTGRYDGENFRVGLVSLVDRPHDTLIQSVERIARSAHATRSQETSR